MTEQQLDQLIYDGAIAGGFTPTSAKFLVAQSRLETYHYTSAVFKANNNLFGMKFIGQPLATKGTLAPLNERSSNCRINSVCVDSDHYAKFASPQDSVNDEVNRYFNITRNGVTPEQLRNSKTPEEYAHLLKVRGYFGGSEADYASTIKSVLYRIKVSEYVEEAMQFYQDNKKKINLAIIGAVIISLSVYGYFMYKKYKK